MEGGTQFWHPFPQAMWSAGKGWSSPLPSHRSELTSIICGCRQHLLTGWGAKQDLALQLTCQQSPPILAGGVGGGSRSHPFPYSRPSFLGHFFLFFFILFFFFCRSGRPLTVRLSVKNHDQAHGFFNLYILEGLEAVLGWAICVCCVRAACCCEARRLSALGRLLVTAMSPCGVVLSCLDSTTPPVPFGVCRCGCRLLAEASDTWGTCKWPETQMAIGLTFQECEREGQ